MSGIYIPGLKELSCDDCFWGIGSRLGCHATPEAVTRKINGRAADCPLIFLGDHGRLGDLDVLAGQMQRNLFEIEDKAERELGFDETLRRGMQYGHAVCVDAVNDAPTVIPADEEAEK